MFHNIIIYVHLYVCCQMCLLYTYIYIYKGKKYVNSQEKILYIYNMINIIWLYDTSITPSPLDRAGGHNANDIILKDPCAVFVLFQMQGNLSNSNM